MFKRILIGGGATGALVAAYFVGSLTLGGALAQTNPTPSPTTPATTQPAGREKGTKPESANEAAESAALAAQAKITADQAKAAALAKFPAAARCSGPKPKAPKPKAPRRGLKPPTDLVRMSRWGEQFPHPLLDVPVVRTGSRFHGHFMLQVEDRKQCHRTPLWRPSLEL